MTQADLAAIRAKSGQNASGPNDPYDPNRDGKINVADVRYCQLRLTPPCRLTEDLAGSCCPGIRGRAVSEPKHLIGQVLAKEPESVIRLENQELISINRTLRTLAIAAVAATAFLGQAQALPTVSISPDTRPSPWANSASIAIIVSGLTQPADAVRGFSLTLAFNDTFLSERRLHSSTRTRKWALSTLTTTSAGASREAPSTCSTLPMSRRTNRARRPCRGRRLTLATVQFDGLANGLSPLRLSG